MTDAERKTIRERWQRDYGHLALLFEDAKYIMEGVALRGCDDILALLTALEAAEQQVNHEAYVSDKRKQERDVAEARAERAERALRIAAHRYVDEVYHDPTPELEAKTGKRQGGQIMSENVTATFRPQLIIPISPDAWEQLSNKTRLAILGELGLLKVKIVQTDEGQQHVILEP